MSDGGALRLRLPARADALDAARLQVLDHLAPLQWPPQRLGVVELVLEELFMNLLMHAHGGGAGHAVDLVVQADAAGVSLEFIDGGRPFDPMPYRQRDRPATLAQAQPGGLGLYLVHRFASDVTHWRADGCNHLRVAIAR